MSITMSRANLTTTPTVQELQVLKLSTGLALPQAPPTAPYPADLLFNLSFSPSDEGRSLRFDIPAQQRQHFDHRKDDPVRFSVLARFISINGGGSTHLHHSEIMSRCCLPRRMHILSRPRASLYRPTPPTTRAPAVLSWIASRAQMILQ